MPRTSMAAMIAALLTAAIGCNLAVPEEPPQPCDGGPTATSCPFGYTCQNDPDDACDPAVGECSKVCVPTQCGGILGIACLQGHVCVDDPSDSCDPKLGGADCIGRCEQEDGFDSVDCQHPDRAFVSHDAALCDQIQWICEPGWIQFYDQCGCGCMLEGA